MLQRRTFLAGLLSPLFLTKTGSTFPSLFPMRLYNSGPVVHRSLMVLCENDSQVFTGFAANTKFGVRWFTANDFNMKFPMAVDTWSWIKSEREKLHTQWYEE